jgi:hypothetical protein
MSNEFEAEHETSVAIESIRFEVADGVPVEVSNSVLDLDIFESIDKPYLTAVMSFVAQEGTFEMLTLSGGERISISLTVRDGQLIKKSFYLDKVIRSEKIKDDQEHYIAHLIEDIAFLSKTQNVNVSYEGHGGEIVSKIAKDFLKKGVVEEGTGERQYMKLIVPNLNPIEALHWIKNRLSTDKGFPFYLFSSLGEEDLELADLQHLLTQPVINPDIPYSFTESSISNTKPMGKMQRRTILSYQTKDTANMFSMLDKGVIGSQYNYINVSNRSAGDFIFDIDVEVNDTLKKTNVVRDESILEILKYDWSRSQVPISKRITQIAGTQAHANWLSLSECHDVSGHKAKVTSLAMSNLLTKDSMLISVNGYDFLDGVSNSSVGRKIRMLFLLDKSFAEGQETVDATFDKNKSGDFLIFGCKHSIRQESYTVSMSVVKIDNSEPEVGLS